MYSEESLAYCSGQCQASRYPPVTCRCPCGGRNHGVLRPRGPINVTPYGYENPVIPIEPSYPSLPLRPGYFLPGERQLENAKPVPQRVERVEIRKGKARLKTTKSFLKAITGYRTQDDLNETVLKGLRTQFNLDRVESIIDQAFSIRMSQTPEANRPELYELYETGEIDKALELFGTRWVIGRPKLKR